MTAPNPHPHAQATDPATLTRLFGATDVLPLWIAEPALPPPAAVQQALVDRAALGWYGYQIRPDSTREAFWGWMADRHGWAGADLATLVSPSIGTSIGVLLDRLTGPDTTVVTQPPVFTDFKALIRDARRRQGRNALVLTDDRYEMDVDDLAAVLAEPSTEAMILCNPHNPVGRAWSPQELRAVAELAAEHDVLIIADEIHADLVLPGHRFTPFAVAAAGTGARWAALHGPIKTFGLAGVCDTLLITDDESVAEAFQTASDQLHLTRNNVCSLAATAAAYTGGAGWVDELLLLVDGNLARLGEGLQHGLRVIPTEATYMAWLDLRALGIDVAEQARWMGRAGVAMSPGHWFGREGAGFARMTVAADSSVIEEAISRLNRAAGAI